MNSIFYIGHAGLGLLGSRLVAALLPTPNEARADEDHSGWSLNFTPVLVAPHHGYRRGGDADPELKYTIDRDGARLSCRGSSVASFDSHRWTPPSRSTFDSVGGSHAYCT